MTARIDDPEYREMLHILMSEAEWQRAVANSFLNLAKEIADHRKDFNKRVDYIFNKYHGGNHGSN